MYVTLYMYMYAMNFVLVIRDCDVLKVGKYCMCVQSGAHKCHFAAPRSIQHRMIAWNSDVLTAAARLCPYSDRSYVTATTKATQVYNYYCSDCPIWSMTERSKFLFRTSLFSLVGRSLAPLCSAYGLLVQLGEGLKPLPPPPPPPHASLPGPQMVHGSNDI